MSSRLLSRLVLGASVSTLLIAASACSTQTSEEDDVASGEDAVSTRNMTANDFGLKEKEIVLTLDDGPGPRTVELAEWLAANDVPTVWFMVGKNAKANPNAVAKVAELSRSKNGLFIIANHSMTHTTPLPKQGLQGSINEIVNADGVLKDNIEKSQSVGYSSPVSFFRPPYGAFTALGPANIAKVNEHPSAGRYIGPVFWDIGGELSANYSADWACWGKVTVDRCIDGYIAESTAKKRGVLLAHDVHSKTVDMLTGKGSANGRSLIKDMRAAGFKFVSLRAHEQAVETFGQQQEQVSSSTAVTIDAAVTTQNNGRVVVDIRTEGDAKIVVAFDAQAPTAEFRGNKQVDVTLAPGQHFVTVSAVGADGTIKKQERYTFIIAADIQPGTPEATNEQNASCVKFDLLKVGSKFNIFHGKLQCDAAGAQRVPGVDGECYRFKGALSASRNPQLIGAGEWSTELDMTYEADPRDKSKVGFDIDARTGEIQHGRRFAWTVGSQRRDDASFEVTSFDCAAGLWRGTIKYASGASEAFLYKRAQ